MRSRSAWNHLSAPLRTTVLHLARAASVLLNDGDGEGFRGSAEQLEVVHVGQAADPGARFPTVVEWTRAWRGAVAAPCVAGMLRTMTTSKVEWPTRLAVTVEAVVAEP